ncbi:hypothetical protein CHS0354_001218 [Potamilus streckersoni]|uniref:Amino acid transporter n=1 Tax=Potamilus streckersoni TaxID=2493646 RepID=A0AAE0RV50_9BIVA|nr:hypothetical protein CHS0354_001218 [Potamilus streckersoni]
MNTDLLTGKQVEKYKFDDGSGEGSSPSFLTSSSSSSSMSSRRRKEGCVRFLKKNLLLLLTIFGVVLGFALGFSVREAHPSETVIMWLGFGGELYLRMLKMMIVPLIFCSVVAGTASMDPKSNGQISLVSFIFILASNVLSAAVGLSLALILKPGVAGGTPQSNSKMENALQTQDILADLIRNIFPDNLVEASFRKTQTRYYKEDISVSQNVTNGTAVAETVINLTKEIGKTDAANILGMIFAASLLGIAAGSLKEKGKPYLDFFIACSDTVVVVVRWLMWVTPIGVTSLIAVSVASVADVRNVFSQLGMFIACVTIGIAIHQIVMMPLTLFIFTRRNPFSFLLSIARPWMIAFASTSTAVAIPEMNYVCEEKQKIDKRVVRFVIPFSVTLSCNGGAVYIASSCIFIANLTGSSTSIGDILMIGLLTTIAAMAVPSVPSASVMAVVMILTSMSIPVGDIALLLAVEWYLDRIRSTSSVVSHTFNAAVTYHLCKKRLEEQEEAYMRRNETEMTLLSKNVEEKTEILEVINVV